MFFKTCSSSSYCKAFKLCGCLAALVSACLSFAANAQLVSGSALDASISPSGDVDSYTFSASVGDNIVIQVADLSGGPFFPSIRLEDPNSVQVTADLSSIVAAIQHEATLNGTYTVFVEDGTSGGNETGAYRLHYVNAPGPLVTPAGDEGGILTNGDYQDAFIDLGDLDAFNFSASIGETFQVRAGDTGASSLLPRIRVFDPNGLEVSDDFGTVAAAIEHQATVAGDYIVVVSDGSSGNAFTGNYRIHYVKAPGSFTIGSGDEGGSTTNGGAHPGTLDIGDLDVYTLEAFVGDTILAQAGDLNLDPFLPKIELYDPTGLQVKTDQGNSAAVIPPHPVTVAGTYTLVISDGSSSNGAIGDYKLHVASIPGEYTTPLLDEGGALINGGAQPGFIERGDLDVWEFGALVGAEISIEVEDTGGTSLFPFLRVYDPAGMLVSTHLHSTLATANHTASMDGKYTVVVSDGGSGNANEGDYEIRYTSTKDVPLDTFTYLVPIPTYALVILSCLGFLTVYLRHR